MAELPCRKKSMAKTTFMPTILFIGVLLVCGLANTPAAAALQRLQVGMQAPDITLKGIRGENRRFAELKGEKLTAVVFWSTWSSKSGEVLARMQKLYDRYRDRGFTVIAVNADEQNLSDQTITAVKAMVDKLALGYPVLLDQGLAAFNDFGVIALPSTVVVDGGRFVRFELSGYPLEGAEQLAEFIAETIEGRKPAATGTISRQPAPAAVRAFNMAKALQKSKYTADNAEMWLKKAVEADPEFLLARISLARVYSQRGADDRASTELKQVLQRDPANVMALCDFGLIALKQGKTGEAVTLLEKALKISNALPECTTYAALAHGRSGDMDKAMQLFEQAAQINPRDPVIYEYKGKLLEEKGRMPEAASSYLQALEKILQAR
ncbi:TlpA disulfide reductase family protein [Geomonas agri]|uniref:TlpA disulfide reductase family protein n=1 Tax=Geomonas agri TaxID=2873702 RepID=UPI001CD62DA6|nr:TlpA disulfide reductase family protein [Geomonas agri]